MSCSPDLRARTNIWMPVARAPNLTRRDGVILKVTHPSEPGRGLGRGGRRAERECDDEDQCSLDGVLTAVGDVEACRECSP